MHGYRVVSNICDIVCTVCDCLYSKRNTTRVVNTKLDTHIYTLWQDFGIHWPLGHNVKGQGHRVTKCAAGMGVHVDMTA